MFTNIKCLFIIVSEIPINCKGVKISWDHGRKHGVYSYSTVQTGKFEHSATANSTFSGWKKPGVVADAQQFVGTGTASAYWNCR